MIDDPFEIPCTECGFYDCLGHTEPAQVSNNRSRLLLVSIAIGALSLGIVGTALTMRLSSPDEGSDKDVAGPGVVVTVPKSANSLAPELPPKAIDVWGSEMLKIVNEEREKNGVTELSWCQTLSDSSIAHSEDMARRKYFEHTSPEGEEVKDRVAREGYEYTTVGENIAVGQKTVVEVMEAWMKSPGHRANILLPDYSHFGLGYVIGEYEGFPAIFWTQNFGSGGECG